MRPFIFMLFMLLLPVCGAESNQLSHVDSEWLVDFDQARTLARQSGRLILVDFTGSDWCVACQALDRDVFSTPRFREYAAKDLVLFKADFPMQKKQAEQIDRQNEKLGKTYGVVSLPTVLLVDAGSELVGRVSYEKGDDVAVFLKNLKEIRENRTSGN